MTLEINRSHLKINHSRQTYGILALLGDVGGFYGAIATIIAYILGSYAPR
jgi:hypothetical protein